MAFSDVVEKMKGLVKFGPYKYTALPENVSREEVQKRARIWADRHKKAVKLTLAAMALLAILYFVFEFRRALAAPTASCDTPEFGFQCEPEISHFWGQYSPYYSVPSEISAAVPAGCEITMAQVLSRHGARDPTASKSASYAALIKRIHGSVAEYGEQARFIRDYNYTLGADELTAFGQQQMVNSGVNFYRRYARLARDVPPFIRSAGQQRVVDSARKWTEGFHQSREDDRRAGPPPGSYPYDILVIPEGEEYNNTLSDELCTAFEEGPDGGREAQLAWLKVFAPAVAGRLNGQLLRGANLSLQETVSVMDLCPYNTVADRGGRLSPFCGLFTPDEWRAYDYYQSLGKWYGYGDGSALGPTRGVGFANELVARLTGRPVEDATSTNATLDGDAATFPLGHGRRLYADFSHDNDMTSIYAALGLYNTTAPLPWTERRGPRATAGFASSWTVPFAARMYVEKMVCPAAAAAAANKGSGGAGAGAGAGGKGEEFVRVLVNDRVIPLQNCGADGLGRCRLDSYVKSLSFATSGGHWDLCFK